MHVQILLFSAALLEAVQSEISASGDQTAGYGGEAHYRCSVINMPGVAQITWQRQFIDNSYENLATYSKRFGQQVNEPHQGKMVFTEASLSSSAITVKNLTWGDESCYICSFSVYPVGSKRRQTCLTVNGISEVTTDSFVQSNEQSAEVTFTCSATGKPTPTIEWGPSSPDLPSSQSPTTTQTNGDSTFTSTRNISVQVPSDWSGYVDCLVNIGMVGERRKRIPLTLNQGKQDKNEGIAASVLPVALLVSFACILCLTVPAAAVLLKRRFKSVYQREEQPALNQAEA